MTSGELQQINKVKEKTRFSHLRQTPNNQWTTDRQIGERGRGNGKREGAKGEGATHGRKEERQRTAPAFRLWEARTEDRQGAQPTDRRTTREGRKTRARGGQIHTQVTSNQLRQNKRNKERKKKVWILWRLLFFLFLVAWTLHKKQHFYFIFFLLVLFIYFIIIFFY